MAGVTGQVRIKGLRELNRALNKVNKGAAKAVRDELKEAAEPVRQTAERLAGVEIRNIGPTWSAMRIGSRSATVYVAPRARNQGGSPRPNLGILLLERAMFPAVAAHEDEIVDRVEDALDRLGASAGF